MNKALLFACALLLTLAACKKDTEPSSPQSLLRSGTWMRTGTHATYRDPNSHNDTTVDYTKAGALTDCVVDNSLTFGAGYTGTMHLGTLKCNPGDPDDRPFTWEITNNGANIGIYNTKELFLTEGGDLNNGQLLYLTASTFTVRYSDITTDPIKQVNDTITYTDVFTKH